MIRPRNVTVLEITRLANNLIYNNVSPYETFNPNRTFFSFLPLADDPVKRSSRRNVTTERPNPMPSKTKAPKASDNFIDEVLPFGTVSTLHW